VIWNQLQCNIYSTILPLIVRVNFNNDLGCRINHSVTLIQWN